MELKQAIEKRRSINYFDPEKKVGQETATKILELASLAPSSMNLQPWKVLTVLSDDKKSLLRSVCYDQPKVTEASVVFVLLGDHDYAEKNLDMVFESMAELGYIDKSQKNTFTEKAKGGQGAPDSARRYKQSVLNTALFGMNLMYACAAYGLETHPMGGFDEEKMRREFDIPQTFTPVMLVAAGYMHPEKNLLPRVKRLSPDEFNTIL